MTSIRFLLSQVDSEHRFRQRDLSDIAGSWQEDPAFDTAPATQDTIDAELWR